MPYIFTVMPIYNGFAPLGLVSKFNSGGAIAGVEEQQNQYTIQLKEGGPFAVYLFYYYLLYWIFNNVDILNVK